MKIARQFIILLVALPGIIAHAQTFAPDSLLRKEIHQSIKQRQINLMNALIFQNPSFTPGNSDYSYFHSIIIKGVDSLQFAIEQAPKVYFTEKSARLSRLSALLDYSIAAILSGLMKPNDLPNLFSAYKAIQVCFDQHLKLLPLIANQNAPIGLVMLETLKQSDFPDRSVCTSFVLRNLLSYAPDHLIRAMYEFPDANNVYTLLQLSARIVPEDLYNYSQASASALGKRISNSKDSLVQLINTLSGLPDGQRLMPFLDELFHHRLSISEIRTASASPDINLYYRLLVKTRITYLQRIPKHDTPVAMKSLEARLQTMVSHDYVHVLNALHSQPDAVRLKILNGLSPEELYELCVIGVDELYTSSYLKIYQRLFSSTQLGSYELLKRVGFDHFKRFLKMASAYNTLDDFLSRMDQQDANQLLHDFVAELNQSNSLEDAVDVAESYGSIRNASLRQTILSEVQEEVRKKSLNTNSSVVNIYDLLNTIFKTYEGQEHQDLSTLFGIPQIYRLQNSYLLDARTGAIIIRHFFYGDPDGRKAFDAFISAIKNDSWKIVKNDLWLKAVSLKGRSIVMYANLPLDDNTNKAEEAQEALTKYLDQQDIHPSVLIHRGHSYYLKNTLKYITVENKLIFLGSCGGYHNLNLVFKNSPSASVITTKQEGSLVINQPMIASIIEQLRQGKDLDWIRIWKEWTILFRKDSRFVDYIPPYRNFGAILIVAYNKLSHKSY